MRCGCLWLCICAGGLAILGLAEWGLHAHADEHHHHTHEHRHGDLVHTHHHSHDADDGHEPQPEEGDEHGDGDDHHCCMDHGQPDALPLAVAPREARRLSELDSVSLHLSAIADADFHSEACIPPRAPPQILYAQDALPQLRTIVLLT